MKLSFHFHQVAEAPANDYTLSLTSLNSLLPYLNNLINGIYYLPLNAILTQMSA
jgi:hypothetical protein